MGALAATAILASPPAASADATVVPHGVIEDSGWALARLNQGDPSTPPKALTPGPVYDYNYPESQRPVRLYLIDTAVDNSSGWFDDNPNVRIASSTPVPYDSISTDFSHGTRLLSIISGPEFGAALGVPIEVHCYDIYTQGEESSMGTLCEAIALATIDHQLAQIEDPDLLGVICIANGTAEPDISYTFLAEIEAAVQRGLVVVGSAGNEGVDVLAGNPEEDVLACLKPGYLPGAYGAIEGFISVGASDTLNNRTSISNYGSPVDIYAPGVDVPTFDPSKPGSGQTIPMRGTSPATALVAAAVAVERSRQPSLSPAEIEAELKMRTYAGQGQVNVLQMDDDLDDDGCVDAIERLFGYPIDDASKRPPAPTLSVGQQLTELSFTISESLWQSESPMALSDKSSWRLLASTDLKEWIEVETVLSFGEASDGRVPVSAISPTGMDLAVHAVEENRPNGSQALGSSTLSQAELMEELFENNPELLPDWYWDIQNGGPSSSGAPSAATVSSGAFFRLEWIPGDAFAP